MKITAVRLRRLTGIIPGKTDFWEERLARPIERRCHFRICALHF